MSTCKTKDSTREGVVSISPHESSVKGGNQLLVRFAEAVPDVEVFLVFCGSQQRHEVTAERQDDVSLTATIPAHQLAEEVKISVCHLDENGEQRTLFQTQFTYTVDSTQHMVELLVQSVSERGIPLQYFLFPPLPTANALREFDHSLTEVFKATRLPKGWTLVGSITQEEYAGLADCIPQETLLHFAARHCLIFLAHHLLTLPGADIASVLPNQDGHTPLHLSQESGSDGLSQLLTLFINQNLISVPEVEALGDVNKHPWQQKGRREKSSAVDRKTSVDKMRKINNEWRTQVKRAKTSLSNDYPPISSEHFHTSHHRLPSPPPSPLKPFHRRLAVKRRSSIAVMELDHQAPLLHSSPIDVNAEDYYSLAEVDRYRKTSWSRVVGNCMCRSVGTGMNELERLIAEDSVQEKVEGLKTKLVDIEQCENHLVQHSLKRAQVNLLYGLSASCPLLNDGSESATPNSLILSAATSPGMGSPLFSEEEARSADLIKASTSHPLQQEPLDMFSSESSFSRTDTCSSTSSQTQQKSVPIPQVVTTEYTDAAVSLQQSGAKEVVDQDLNRNPEGVESSLNVNRSELNGGDLHNGSYYSTPKVKPDNDRIEREEEEGDESALQTEVGVGASISAPDLLALTAENGVVVSGSPSVTAHSSLQERDIVDQEAHSRTAPVSSSSSPILKNRFQNVTGEVSDYLMDHQLQRNSPIADAVQIGSSQFGSQCMEPSDQDVSTTTVELDSSMATTTTVASPIERTTSSTPVSAYKFNRSHRRSLSTSEVEIASPLRDQMSFRIVESNEDEGEGSSVQNGVFPNVSSWQTSLTTVSKSVGNVSAGESSLSIDERSRASSLHTNETSSRHESEDSSGDEDSRQSLTSISRSSLDPMTEATNAGTDKQGRESIKDSNGNGQHFPAEEHDGELVSKRRALNTISTKNRHSADLLVTHIDEFMNDSSEGESDQFNHRRSLPSRGYMRNAENISTVQPQDTPVSKGGEGRRELESSGHNSSKSSEMSREANSADHQVSKKSSGLSNDSVFDDHDVTLSDVDVKLASDDSSLSVPPSLENSFEQSQLSSTSVVKESGSPKVSKRWHRSPLLRRKTTTLPGESPSQRRKGGLTKAEITPTIRTLKDLLGSTSGDLLSDDSDTTVGAEIIPARPKSATGIKSPAASVHRSSSTASDSVVFKEDMRKRTVIVDRPVPPLLNMDFTSLDFGGGSPRLARKPLVESPAHHPPSPLFFQTKSPPLTNQDNKEASEKYIYKRNSDAAVDTKAVTRTFYGKLRPAQSLDESTFRENPHLLPPNFEPQPTLMEESEPSLDRKNSAEGYPEPKGADEISVDRSSSEPGPELSKGGVKKLIRGAFSRSSKNSKKGKGQSGTSNETEQTSKALRGKSKIRPKVDSNTFEDPKGRQDENLVFVSPQSYAGLLRRSESMQVGLDGKSVGPEVLISQFRRDSDSSLTQSPTKLMFDTKSLSTLEETPASTVTPPPASTVTAPPPASLSATAPAAISISPSDAPLSDSETEETHEEDQLVRSLSTSYPELAVQEEPSWDKTIDRKVYRKLNKAERERQAVLHELLQTEKHHLRALHVLKLIFYQNILKVIPEDVLNQMFPELDSMIEISDSFIQGLEEQKNSNAKSNMIEDFSDVLYKQFSGEMREKILHAFGGFCSGHLTAMEVYKEQLKKKQFARLMKELHKLKECQRLTLPDYYTQVGLRLTKLVTLLQRLVKRTESLKLNHAPRLRESMENLQQLVSAVDQAVDDHKNRMELMDVQSRLEVTVPKSAKSCIRKEIKSLNLLAQDRKLRKRGDAMWMGHGKHLPVHVILVTDFLLVLTERDQKYHLAALQDLKPPVIRLYDLHVRLNAAVKSGVQLLLLEQGDFPEMFKFEFSDKKEAKEWQTTLNSAVEECKEKGLKCEHFGSEKVLSGDEERKSEEKEGDSDPEETSKMEKKEEAQPVNPSLRKLQHARESLELATKLLSMSTTTVDSSQRHTVAGGISRPFRDSPKNRLRAQTVFVRPKVAEEVGDCTAGDIPPHGATTKAKVKSTKKVARTATFKSKDKDREKEKEKEKDKGGGGGHTAAEASEGTKIHELQFVECITHLKGSLEDMMSETEEKDELIAKLRNEVESLRESLKLAEQNNSSQELQGSSPVLQRSSVRGSPPQPRPYSCHVVLNGEGEGDGHGAGNSATVDDSRDSTLSPSAISNTHHDDSEYESSDTGTFLVPEHV